MQPGIAGHSTDPCPYGHADDPGDLQAGRELVKSSASAGAPVTVWVEDSWPQRAYAGYYSKLLNRLGFDSHLRVAASPRDFGRIGKRSTDPQTGFASWFNDFPNPADSYEVVDASPGPTPSANVGRVDDLFIQQQLAGLNLVPAQELSKSAGQWRELDEYTAKKAYLAVFGTQQVPKLMSERMNFDSAVIHPLFLSDWSTWSLR